MVFKRLFVINIVITLMENLVLYFLTLGTITKRFMNLQLQNNLHIFKNFVII